MGHPHPRVRTQLGPEDTVLAEWPGRGCKGQAAPQPECRPAVTSPAAPAGPRRSSCPGLVSPPRTLWRWAASLRQRRTEAPREGRPVCCLGTGLSPAAGVQPPGWGRFRDRSGRDSATGLGPCQALRWTGLHMSWAGRGEQRATPAVIEDGMGQAGPPSGGPHSSPCTPKARPEVRPAPGVRPGQPFHGACGQDPALG